MAESAHRVSRRIRVLSICETAQGGVGIYQNILRNLEDVGFDFHVVAPAQHCQVFDKGLEVSTFDRPGRSIGAIFRLLQTFVCARKKFRPDVCFFHSTFSLSALALARLQPGRPPLVYCAHGWAVRNYHSHSLKGRVVRLIEGRLCGLADVVINVSQSERDLALAHGYRGHHVVVDNAVRPPAADADCTLFADHPDRTHLLFVGRFDRQKGLDLLLPAFAATREIRPDLMLHVVGAVVREAVADDASMCDVDNVGWVSADRIDDWYLSADALVVPSRWEGLPLVIPEAYRNGTPVLCSTASGMDQLVVQGQTGASFDLTPQDITAALVRYSKADLQAMSGAARQRYLDRYQIDRLRDAVADILRGLLP
jgi:glycosyltransferase involved in cell wall biosynthesis